MQESFRNVFSHIQPGIVSTFYGYHEIDIFDDYALEQARILIVTPEKLDGMLRHYPDLASQIKLVVADEGHIIGESNIRGYKYRFLLERLIFILDKKSISETIKPRIMLVSGVLPHMEDFADFVSGSQQNVVNIDWRPVEEPRIGSWVWNGNRFTSTDSQLPAPLPFQNSICHEDDKFEEQVVLTAIQCAMTSFTMVFSASKSILQRKKFLGLLKCLVDSNSTIFPIHDPVPPDLQKYPLHFALLEKGIAIHHKDVPSAVKHEVEKRISNGNNIRLIFASPTLAQGVNIPFDTVLAYRLHHSYFPNYIPISASVFWNVVGRVGRPISQKKKTASKLDAPSLLFLLNEAPQATNDDRNDYRVSIELQKNGREYQVASSFLKFLSVVKERTALSPESLVIELAEKKNLQDIIGLSSSYKFGEMTLEQYLIMLDAQLFDLLNESFPNIEITADWLQQSAKGLVDLFVKASDIKPEDLEFIRNAVIARLVFISRNTSATKRQQDYLLGLPNSDCEKIKSHKEELSAFYQGCLMLFSGDQNTGMENLVNLMDFISSLSICERKKRRSPKADTVNQALVAKRIEKKRIAKHALFHNWLNGVPDSELEKNLKFISTIELSKYKEATLDRMPWGISAIGRYISAILKEDGLSLSRDLEYLPSFIKYGVNSKIACHLVRLGVLRTDAVKISEAYKEKIKKVEIEDEDIYIFETDFYETINSLNTFTDDEFKKLGISDETTVRVSEIQTKYKRETIGIEPEFPPFDAFDDNE